MKQKAMPAGRQGFIYILPLLALLLIVTAGSLYYLNKNKIAVPPIFPSPSPFSSPAATPPLKEKVKRPQMRRTYVNEDNSYSIKYRSDKYIQEVCNEYKDVFILEENDYEKDYVVYKEECGGDTRASFAILFAEKPIVPKTNRDYFVSSVTTTLANKTATKYVAKVKTGAEVSDLAYPYVEWHIPFNSGFVIIYSYFQQEETNQLISNFAFLNNDSSIEGKPCGGFFGEKGEYACPSGYYCQYPEPMYPDAQGKCIKK